VKYSGVYPGVDLVYYGNQQQLEYDFVVAPGASVKPVKLHFAGASKLKLNADGDLSVIAKNGEIAFHKPVVYQEKDGQRQPVAGKFTLLAGNKVGFTLGDYDRSRELVIDPVLAYSTYLSSSVGGSNYGYPPVGPAADAQGNAYVVLENSNNVPSFPPTRGAYTYGAEDIVIMKLNPAGTAVIYIAAFGGEYGFDNVGAIAVDSSGSAYIVGNAEADFPVTPGAFQTSSGGSSFPEFVTKLNPSGSGLDYSTYLHGSGHESGNAIALDSSGNAFIAGATTSRDFPVTSGAFQTVNKSTSSGDASTGFVAKLNATGTALVFATYLGGSGGNLGFGDFVDAIAVDQTGNAYVAGATTSTDFPVTPGAYLTSNDYLGFATKLNAGGSALLYSTYFPYQGYSVFNQDGGFAVDAAGNLYAGGQTPTDLKEVATVKATSGAFQLSLGSSYSGYVSKLNPAGSAMVYTTYLGGSSRSSVSALAVDAAGDVYATGLTYDDDFPVTSDAYQNVNRGAGTNHSNAFLTEFNNAGSELRYSTYLGGSAGTSYYIASIGDSGTGVALDSLGNAYVAGVAGSPYFPVTNGVFQTQASLTANTDFLAKFAFHGATTTTVTPDGSPEPVGAAVTLTAYVASVQDDNTPYGEVQFIIDGVTVGASLTDDTGHATYSTSSLLAGTHMIQATYIGSPSHAASTGTGSVTIVGATATPSLTPVGGTYRVVYVTITDPTSGAMIHYTTNGSTPSASSPVYSTPIAVTSTTTVKTIAIASGDSPSAVAAATYTIVSGAKNTTTSLTASPTTVTGGATVSLVATVTTTDGTVAQGTVTFLHGSVVFGTAALSNGTASLNTTGSALGDGLHSITAFYSGSATEAASQSPAVAVSVSP
jgi:hypothetical protein